MSISALKRHGVKRTLEDSERIRALRRGLRLQVLEELGKTHFQSRGNRVQRVDSGRNGPVFDLREVRPADLRHVRKQCLGQSVLLPREANSSAQADWKRYCHSAMISFNVVTTVRYTEQREEA